MLFKSGCILMAVFQRSLGLSHCVRFGRLWSRNGLLSLSGATMRVYNKLAPVGLGASPGKSRFLCSPSSAVACLTGLSISLLIERGNASEPGGCNQEDKGLVGVPACGAGPVKGPERAVGLFSVADAVAKVDQGVVNIKRIATRPVETSSGLFSELFLERGQQDVGSRILPDTHAEIISGGSGFVVDRIGTTSTYFILTNSHVVEDIVCPCSDRRSRPRIESGSPQDENVILVTLASGDVHSAKLVATDHQSDIALLTIESDDDLEICTLGESETLRPGEFVVAVGSPLAVLSNSCSFGIVSNANRDMRAAIGVDTGTNFVQVDCAVNPGSSGGPLIDLDGVVRGMLCMKIGLFEQGVASGQEGQVPVEGISFAIPISRARKVLGELREFGYVRRPHVGISLVAVDASYLRELRQNLDLPDAPRWLSTLSDSDIATVEGLLVREVENGGPAHIAKLLPGDVIVDVDGTRVTSAADFKEALAFQIGNTVSLGVFRATTGKKDIVRVTPIAEATQC